MAEVAAQDKRGFFILPQAFEGGGYYVYGTPRGRRGQYAHSKMISVLQTVACNWCHIDGRRFGVGNISLENGELFAPHRTHRNGLQVDIRTIRKDGRHIPCSRLETAYDQEATAKLIKLFLQHPLVDHIRFNDLAIAGVRPLKRHDDHFHVELR